MPEPKKIPGKVKWTIKGELVAEIPQREAAFLSRGKSVIEVDGVVGKVRNFGQLFSGKQYAYLDYISGHLPPKPIVEDIELQDDGRGEMGSAIISHSLKGNKMSIKVISKKAKGSFLTAKNADEAIEMAKKANDENLMDADDWVSEEQVKALDPKLQKAGQSVIRYVDNATMLLENFPGDSNAKAKAAEAAKQIERIAYDFWKWLFNTYNQ